jgi:hypothetical protein
VQHFPPSNAVPMYEVLRLIFLVSRLSPFRDPDVRETWLPMGVECIGVPDGGHDAVPVHLLQVREAD